MYTLYVVPHALPIIAMKKIIHTSAITSNLIKYCAYILYFSVFIYRFFHNPWLYKHVHKIHHRYVSPTLYSTTAMHPLEFLMYQTFLALPVFTVPLHAGEARQGILI